MTAKEDCAAHSHHDPDHTGICILCNALLFETVSQDVAVAAAFDEWERAGRPTEQRFMIIDCGLHLVTVAMGVIVDMEEVPS